MKGQEGEPLSFVLKTGVLILLCFQNSGHALLTRYSQGVMKESYSSSGYLSLTEKSETGFSKLVWLALNAKKVIILVVLYSIANIASYFALARVDASVYTVLLQLKTLTTPAFAVILLHRNISSVKWRALLLLVLGCVLVASPTFHGELDCGKNALDTENDDSKASSASTESAVGVAAILLMVTISGYSAIYFEGMLKTQGERVTIWERNFQLALFSLILMIGVIGYESNVTINSVGTAAPFLQYYVPFKGWTINTVGIALIQAVGGLLVAATLKYTDAVLKTLATSGSIVLSTMMGTLLLGGQFDIFVAIGCVATILAIFNYTLS